MFVKKKSFLFVKTLSLEFLLYTPLETDNRYVNLDHSRDSMVNLKI